MVFTYLLPLVFLGYKVGCQVKRSLYGLGCMFQRPDILQRIAYQSKRGQSKLLPTMHFDTDSFIVGSTPLLQLLCQPNRTSLLISFSTQVSQYKEYKGVYQ
jgi:hypothetical protein